MGVLAIPGFTVTMGSPIMIRSKYEKGTDRGSLGRGLRLEWHIWCRRFFGSVRADCPPWDPAREDSRAESRGTCDPAPQGRRVAIALQQGELRLMKLSRMNTILALLYAFTDPLHRKSSSLPLSPTKVHGNQDDSKSNHRLKHTSKLSLQ